MPAVDGAMVCNARAKWSCGYTERCMKCRTCRDFRQRTKGTSAARQLRETGAQSGGKRPPLLGHFPHHCTHL